MTILIAAYILAAICTGAVLADAFDLDNMLKVGVWLIVATLWGPVAVVLAIVWALSAMRRGYVAARGEL